jgi:hypothetical protein
VEEGMSPIEAAIKGSNEIFFCGNLHFHHLMAVFLPVIFLEGFGTSVSGICVVIGAAVHFSFCLANIDADVECLFNERWRTKEISFLCIDRTLFPEIK